MASPGPKVGAGDVLKGELTYGKENGNLKDMKAYTVKATPDPHALPQPQPARAGLDSRGFGFGFACEKGFLSRFFPDGATSIFPPFLYNCFFSWKIKNIQERGG